MSNRTYSSVPTDLRGTANFPYIWDAALVQSGTVPPITGNWRVWTTNDISNNNISLTGATFSIQSVAVTGGSINVAGGSLALTNPILAISGIVSAPNGFIGIDTGVRAVQVTNTAPLPFSGTVQGGNSLPFYVTGSVISVVTGLVVSSSSSVAVTGNPGVIVTGGTLNVSVTGGVLSASSSSVSLTGFSPTLPPLPVSGLFTVVTADTGNRSVLVVNTAPMPVSGVVQAQVTIGNLAITGFNSTIAPLAVSGSFTATPGNTAITGFDSKIAPLAVSGSFTSTPGNTAVTGLGSVDLTHSYIPVSGVNFSASVSVSAVAITGQNSGSALGNLDVTRTYLPISGAGGGFIGIDTGIRAVNIVSSINQFVVNSGGYTAITGSVAVTNAAGFIGIDTGIRAVNLTNTSPIPISGVVNTTVTVGNVSVTGGQIYAIDTLGNALLSGISGQLAANLAGSAPVTGDIRNIPGTVLAISGVVNTTVSVSNVTITGFNSTIAPLAVSGNFGAVSVSNPIGATGTAYDRNPILSGFGTYNFQPVGGRVANPSGAGALTGYTTGSFAMLNMSPQGALFVSQGVLDKNYDQVTIFAASTGLASNSTVSGLNTPTWGQILPNNPARRAWYIQNTSTGAMFVKFGATPNSGSYNVLLKGGTAQNDGNAASWSDAPAIYTGPVYLTGYFSVAASYISWEL